MSLRANSGFSTTFTRSSTSILYEAGVTYDKVVKAVTSGVIALLLVLSLLISYLAYMYGDQLSLILTILLITDCSIIMVPYLFAPRAFSITSKGILIKRLIGGILIPFDDVLSVRRVKVGLGARLFGSGGLYGYYGLFYVSGLGRVWMYATDKDKLLLIKTRKGKNYIVSPSDPAMFMERLKVMNVNVEG